MQRAVVALQTTLGYLAAWAERAKRRAEVLAQLQTKNKSLRVVFDAKQKVVAEQRRLIDQRKTQIESVSQKVSRSQDLPRVAG